MPGMQTLMKRLAFASVFCLLLASTLHAERVSLGGTWKFLTDPGGRLQPGDLASASGWRDIRVPGSWNSQFADLRDYGGYAWYQRDFVLPAAEPGARIRLVFLACDYQTEVYLNGELLGFHEGGYLPFNFDITNRARPTNRLQLRVLDPPQKGGEHLPVRYNEIPHGKQDWYIQTGGLWQNVYLEVRSDPYIEKLRITPLEHGRVQVALTLAGERAISGASGRIRILDNQNATVVTTSFNWNSGATHTQTILVPDAKLWSPEAPNLYRLDCEIGQRDKDRVEDRFGFRSIQARDGHLYLNGKPYFLIGALDQDFYPETVYSPPSREYVRDQFLKARQMGLNSLRCHIKVPDPLYYEVADEVGLLIWTDIPNFDKLTEASRKRLIDTFHGMLERDWNHPSLAILTIFNEAWGIDMRDSDQRAFLKQTFADLKTAAEGRLLVDNSPCCENFHMASDLNDFHNYFAIPDNHRDFDRWVADFGTAPRWTYSPYGDSQRSGREPLIVSEFGNWGLPRIDQPVRWWFERGFGDTRPITRPAGVLERFDQHHFRRLFRDYNALAEATQTHQFQSLQHEIQAIRTQPLIRGYVITEFTDLNWEANGLLDMERNLKNFSAPLAAIQQQTIVFPQLERFNFWEGEEIVFDVMLSRYDTSAKGPLRVEVLVAGAITPLLRWDANPPSEAGVYNLGVFRGRAPSVRAATTLRLQMRVTSAGAPVANNLVDVYVYPKAARGATRLHVVDGSNGVKSELQLHGYTLVDDPAKSDLVVAWTWNEAVEKHVVSGGKALVMVERAEALPPGRTLQAATRQSDQLDGNWVTSFIWGWRAQNPFSAVPLQDFLGFEAEAALPRLVLKGVAPEQFGAVHSGIFAGWIHQNRALAVETSTGAGRAFVTTFRFNESYGRDAYATHLMDAMIQHTLGGDFTAAVKW